MVKRHVDTQRMRDFVCNKVRKPRGVGKVPHAHKVAPATAVRAPLADVMPCARVGAASGGSQLAASLSCRHELPFHLSLSDPRNFKVIAKSQPNCPTVPHYWRASFDFRRKS